MLASAVRYNALAATLPIIVLLFRWRPVSARCSAMRSPPRRGSRSRSPGSGSCRAHRYRDAPLALVPRRPRHRRHAEHVDGELPDAELEQLFDGTGLRSTTGSTRPCASSTRPATSFRSSTMPSARCGTLPVAGSTPAPPEVRDAIARVWSELVDDLPARVCPASLEVMKEVLCLGHTRSRPGDGAAARPGSIADARGSACRPGRRGFSARRAGGCRVWLKCRSCAVDLPGVSLSLLAVLPGATATCSPCCRGLCWRRRCWCSRRLPTTATRTGW